MSMANSKRASLALTLFLLVGIANAQLAIVDDQPGAFVPIPDGIDLQLDTDETAPITTAIGNSQIPSGTLWVGSNGGVGVGDVADTALPPTNEALPSDLVFGGSAAAVVYWTGLWNDLDPGVRYAERSDRLVIEWNRHIDDGPDPGVITFQLQVFDDPGTDPPVFAQLIYHDLDAVTLRDPPTIGYQVGDGVTAVEWTVPVSTDVVLSLIPEPAVGMLLPMVIALCRVRRAVRG
jgi:hypothetical protein